MAFTMRRAPFHQEIPGQPATNEQKPTRLTKPTQPDYSLPEYQGRGTEMRDVPQGRPKNRVIREEISKIKEQAGDNKFTGDVSTTEAYTRRDGSRIGNFFTGNGYSVTKATGNANTSAELSDNKFSGDEKEQFYKKLKTTLKEGKGAQIVDGQVTAGGKHQAEFSYDKKKRAESEYNKSLQAFKRQENQDKETTRLAGIKAEREKVQASQAETRAKNAASLAEKQAKFKADREAQKQAIADRLAANAAKKNGNKQPATNEPVAQQRKTPFYKMGMKGDKMHLQNKNKFMSISPLHQDQNSRTGEAKKKAQEMADADAKAKLAALGENKGDSKNVRTTTGKGSVTVKGKKVEKIAKTPEEIKKWKAASEESKNKYKSQVVTAEATASDTGKDTPPPPPPPPPPIETPKEEPKKKTFKTSSGSVKSRGAEAATGFGGMFNSGGKGKNPCSTCN
jgi:hypothetical protein